MDVPVEYIMGVAASVLTAVFKVLADKYGYSPSRAVVNIVLFVVAVGFSLVFGAPELPVFGDDPVVFLTALLGAATAVVGSASLLYNLLLAKFVYPRLGLA